MVPNTLLIASLVNAVVAQNGYFVFTASSSLLSRAHPTPLPACATIHGQYAGTSVYAIEEDRCESSIRHQEWLESLEAAKILPSDGHFGLDHSLVLLHVQPARTVSGTSQDWTAALESHMNMVLSQLQDDEITREAHPNQRVLGQPATAASIAGIRPQLLHLDTQKDSAFYSLPRSLLPHVDSLFPSNVILVSVPNYPLPAPHTASGVPQWLSDSLRNVHYSPLVDAILQDIDPDVMEKDVRHLTGEDGHSDWRTRHSFTEDGRKAGEWIKALVEKEAGVKCQYHEHDDGFSPNVLCYFKGVEHSEELVILGAHYDSRGTFGQVRAPGADDDASGVSALLSLARLFKAFNIQFKRTVVLAFFSGEEQGLWGSKAYAKHLKEGKKNVRFMLQADMLGYHAPGEPMQIALPDQHDTIEARWLVGNLSMTYVPDLQVGTTPACCSDHQSFDEQGFVSTWVFERNGPIADPKYHNSEDLSDREGYDFKQIAAIAKVMLATVLIVADFTL